MPGLSKSFITGLTPFCQPKLTIVNIAQEHIINRKSTKSNHSSFAANTSKVTSSQEPALKSKTINNLQHLHSLPQEAENTTSKHVL